MRRKLTVCIIFVVFLFIIGCGGYKKVTYTNLGEKVIETKSNAVVYYELQEKLSEKQSNTPLPIATIPQPDGTVITLYSQIPTEKVTAKQHVNQYVKPITSVFSKLGVYGITGYAATEIVKSIKPNTNTINGNNNSIDQSDINSIETNHAEENAILNQDSNKDDNSIQNADPVVIEKETVKVIDPVIVEKETVDIVEPTIIGEEGDILLK